MILTILINIQKTEPIRIRNDCWPGENYVLLPEVQLGNGEIVAVDVEVNKLNKII